MASNLLLHLRAIAGGVMALGRYAMLQRQPWLTGPGSIADAVARTLLAIQGERPLGSEKVHTRGRAGLVLASEQERGGDKQVARRGAAALSRFNRRREG